MIRGLATAAALAAMLATGAAAVMSTPAQSAPVRHYWGLAPPAAAGVFPRGDAWCAARVQRAGEQIAANVPYRHAPPPGTRITWGPWTRQTPEMARNFAHVTGNYTGPTRMIIAWAACKWGMDQDIGLAEGVAESGLHQALLGDWNCGVPDSLGILQVRDRVACGALHSGWGGWPWTRRSTAVAADAQMAYLRAVFDGRSWMGPALRGLIWRAVSSWESGYDSGPDWYTTQIQWCLWARCWAAAR